MASRITNNFMNHILQWVHPKSQERNLISAAFHMITITLISMSMVELKWFSIYGGVCASYLTLSQFFWFGYTDNNIASPEFDCINSTIVNMMRIIILLCFMAIIFSLAGFFLDVIGPKSYLYFFIRKYALASTFTVMWIMAIISTCYYVAVLLEDSLDDLYPKIDTSVTYGYGFYLITATGGVAVIGTFCTLILMHTSSPELYSGGDGSDDACLIDGFEEGFEAFNSPAPPPPYNVPPPPYAP
ncbi:PREDICTED: transmembrane protein 127-like [Nicrophorus vespilloides]|uniref:Transmembrane protein 127-like n=1 Tax=Nicrophorus vespilloides TaxID=110193 RepID=A0ABM1MJX7_NICVS|nr:PREDICTED: transmembrane protein 127-like [Nicrophorus vespilloides]